MLLVFDAISLSFDRLLSYIVTPFKFVSIFLMSLLTSDIEISWDLMFNDEAVYIKKLIASTPLRYTAFHINMPDEKIYHFFKALIISSLPKEYRASIRIHLGSHLECNYKLCSFGLPAEDCPVRFLLFILFLTTQK